MTPPPVPNAPLSLQAKRALLAQRLREGALRADPAATVDAAEDGAAFDLSPGQQAIWLLTRTSRNPALWNTFFAARVDGALAPQALQRAVDLLLQRHPALRCVFTEDGPDGAPRQRVLPHAAVPVQVLECPGLAGAALAEEIGRAHV